MLATGALSLRTKSHPSPMSIMSIPTRHFLVDLITKSWESPQKCRLNIALPDPPLAESWPRLKRWNVHFLFQSLDRFLRDSLGLGHRDPGIDITRR